MTMISSYICPPVVSAKPLNPHTFGYANPATARYFRHNHHLSLTTLSRFHPIHPPYSSTSNPSRTDNTVHMASNPTPRSTPAKPKSKSPYLLTYNALSAALWAAVLLQTITIGFREIRAARKAVVLLGTGDGALGAVKWGLSTGKVYEVLERYTRLTQTLAGMEVVHCLIGKLFYFSSLLHLQHSALFCFAVSGTGWIRIVG